MRFNIGDEVTLGSSNLIFRLIDYNQNKAVLSGKSFRLIKEVDENELISARFFRDVDYSLPQLNRIDTKVKKGRVLHIDGDEYYLNRALQIYKYYKIPTVGYHIQEIRMKDVIVDLIKKHEPDIVVLTGHDGLITGKEDKLYDETSYRYSSYYRDAVKNIRSFRPNLDDLIIVSGACQSYYELLIDAGSNFASSPKRDYIHLMDPVIKIGRAHV